MRIKTVAMLAVTLGAAGMDVRRVNAQEGVFWNELETDVLPPSRRRPAISYCSELDIMVLTGGYISNDLRNDTWVYDFRAQVFEELIGSELFAGQGGVLTNIDPHPSKPSSCRFVRFGGSVITQSQSRRISTTPDVQILEIEAVFEGESRTFNATVNDVNLSGDEVMGRYQMQATGYGNQMFIIGGVEPAPSPNSRNIFMEVMARLTMSEDPATPYDGTWKVVASVPPNRFSFAAGRNESDWIVYAGQGLQVDPFSGNNDVARSDVRKYNLDVLSQVTDFGAIDREVFSAEYGQRSSNRLFRIDHVGAVYDGYFFIYGGNKLVTGGRQNRLMALDFLQITQLSAAGESNPFLNCRDKNGEDVGWCGFQAEFPSVSTEVTSTQRGEFLIVYTISGKFHVLNMKNVLDKGRSQFEDGQLLNDSIQGFDYLAMKALQFSLVAVCLVLLLSLGVLFRQRREPMEMMHHAVKKKLGASLEVVRALDFVKFDAHDGRHIPVIVEWSEDGEPKVVEELEPIEKTGPDGVFGHNVESDISDTATSQNVVGNINGGEDAKSSSEFEEEPDVCAICILEFEHEELLMRLPCKHLFHWDCVEPWLLKNGTCPQCRKHVVTGKEVKGETEGSRNAEAATPADATSTSTQYTSRTDVEMVDLESNESSSNTAGNDEDPDQGDEQLAAANERLSARNSSRRVSQRTSLRASARLSRRLSRRRSSTRGERAEPDDSTISQRISRAFSNLIGANSSTSESVPRTESPGDESEQSARQGSTNNASSV